MVCILFTLVFYGSNSLLLRILTEANIRNGLVGNSFFEQRLQLWPILSSTHMAVRAELSRVRDLCRRSASRRPRAGRTNHKLWDRWRSHT